MKVSPCTSGIEQERKQKEQVSDKAVNQHESPVTDFRKLLHVESDHHMKAVQASNRERLTEGPSSLLPRTGRRSRARACCLSYISTASSFLLEHNREVVPGSSRAKLLLSKLPTANRFCSITLPEVVDQSLGCLGLDFGVIQRRHDGP